MQHSIQSLLFSAFAFVLGAAVGSFLNVCIYRWPVDLSINRSRRFTHLQALRVAMAALLITCVSLRSETPHGAAADSRGLRLILLPSQTSIKPSATVAFDVYVYNSGKTSIEVASLDLFSAVYTIDDITGNRLGRSGGTKSVTTHGSSRHVLKADSIKKMSIKVSVPAEPGDLVKLYVQLGEKPGLRSNSVVLFCPAEKK